jgi:hypothetical protein
VESRKGEGWALSPECYDDGGFTDGNTDRPALQKLLQDIREGRLDVTLTRVRMEAWGMGLDPTRQDGRHVDPRPMD